MQLYIDDYIKIELSHRAYFNFRGAENVFLSSDKYGQMTIFNEKGIVLKNINLGVPLESIAFSPNHGLLAYITDSDLFILDYEKNELVYTEKAKFKAAYFSQQNLCWVVEKIDREWVKIKVYAINTWELIQSVLLEDIYIDSEYIIDEWCDENTVLLWMAAGQDGQSTFLLSLKSPSNEINIEKFSIENTIPPVWNTSKTELAFTDETALTIVDISTKKIKNIITYPSDFLFAGSVFYLNEQELVRVAENGVHLINTYRSSIKEIIIKGHEPRPISYYYPTIKDDDSCIIDIDFIEQIGDYLIGHVTDARKKENYRYYALIFKLYPFYKKIENTHTLF